MLVSFASYQLWQPWQATAHHLAQMFSDYEPGIHYPQVQMQSNTTGINIPRIYNPIKQGYDQDPQGVFIRQYVPELAALPDAFIHQPWRSPDGHELDYPAPIIDLKTATMQARAALSALKRQPGFREESKRVLQKHGSRKHRHFPSRTQAGQKKKRAKPSAQLNLFG